MRPLFSPHARLWLGYGFWCTLAGVGFALTFTFEGDIANYRYGAGGWPRVLFVLMALFASVQFLISRRQLADAPPPAPADDDGQGPVALGGLPLRTVAIPVVYIMLLTPIGFFAATPPFLAAVMISMGERRPLRILAATTGIYAVVILVFIKLLFVPLPVGTWPGFYEFGNWVITAVR